MDHRWTKDAKTPEDKEQRRKEVKSRKQSYDEVIEILEDLFEEGVPDYGSPSWAYQQADRNGANRKLREIIKFLTV